IHTFFDGVSIAAGMMVSPDLGALVFCAVALHKLPEGVTVASIALAAGRSPRTAMLYSLALGAATLLGALAMNVVAGAVALALPLSAGVTLYVAATDLMPEVNEERGFGMAAAVFLGVGLFAATERALTALGL